MRVLLTGGGTGGHINPAIAIAQYFKDRDPKGQILYVGTPEGMEAVLVKKAGFAFAPVSVMGFRRSLSFSGITHNVKALGAVLRARGRARAVLREFKPDLVIGTGGYVCGPVVLEACKMGIKTAIHEQNAFPGVTNRILAKKVDRVFLAVEEAKKYLQTDKPCEIVGNPIRESVVYQSKEAARKALGLDNKLCILSFGGSLGADTINTVAADLMAWHGPKGTINHIHGYGRLGKEKFPQMLKDRKISLENNPNIRALEYIDNMDICMAAADLLICRSGAITVSEIEATGKPAILVPSPNVTANHQYHNARVLSNRGGAILLEEKEYSKDRIIQIVRDLYDHPEKLKTLSENASKLAILDTAARIYNQLTINN